MKRVQLESPYKGNNYEQTELNIAYLDLCIADSLNRGEAPFASHKQYIGATDDKVAEERALGIEAGLSFLSVAEASVVYTDFGVSAGMTQGIKRAVELGVPLEFRTLPEEVLIRLKLSNIKVRKPLGDFIEKEHIHRKYVGSTLFEEHTYTYEVKKTLKEIFYDLCESEDLIYNFYGIKSLKQLQCIPFAIYIEDYEGVSYYINNNLEIIKDGLYIQADFQKIFLKEFKKQIKEARRIFNNQ